MTILVKEQAILKTEKEFQNMIEMVKQATANGVMVHEVEGDLLTVKWNCPIRDEPVQKGKNVCRHVVNYTRIRI